ncbi:AAA family ATPase [Myroides injenensis]|uniref:AAA family ATPase n=1 Tax=Myroides injenensis TaxID=1183151 RepID=UPI0002885CDF|nr:SMC family ATPase [Myroides injenensis]
MIPIKLTIDGLYSYQEKQTIDFTSLIEAGLFGIFGKVGSGKSSILEAISFGLYGESERLNARDNRAYNMMNLKSNRSTIDFEFYNFQDKKYRIYREFKRNSKKFEDVKRGDAILYEWKEEEWIPLPELNIEEIVGLSYENFKRTIIIPQGKFKEFIELKGAERTRMMQDIFGLDRFDLANKTKAIYGKDKESLNLLQGQLKSYAQVSKEEIGLKKEGHQKHKEKLATLSSEFKKENEAYQQQKVVKDDFELLVVKKAELLQLQEKIPQIQKQKKEIEQYQQIDKAFTSLLNEQETTHKKRIQKEEQFNKINNDVVILKEQFEKTAKELKVAEEHYAGLEHLKAERYELDLIKAIKGATEKREVLNEQYQKGNDFVVHAEKALIDSKEHLLHKEQELEKAKSSRIDSNLIMAIGEWFNHYNFFQKGIEEIVNRIKLIKGDIGVIDDEIKQLKLKDITQWEREIENFRLKFDKEQSAIETALRHLNVSQQLTQYANDLHQGQPCPLCGAIDHPHLLQGNDVSTAIKTNELLLEKVKDKQARLIQYERKAAALFDKRHLLFTQLKEEQEKEQTIQIQVEQHQQQFVWNIIEKGNYKQFEKLKKMAESIAQHIEFLEKEFSILTKSVEKNRNNLELAKNKLSSIELEKTKLESEILSKSAQIIRLQIETYVNLDVDSLVQQIKHRDENIAYIEKRFKDLSTEYQKLSPALAALQAEQKTLQETIIELKALLERISLDIDGLIQQFQLSSLDEVRAILSKNINVSELNSEIQAFEVQLEVVRNQVETLEKKLDKVSFDTDQFAKQEVIVLELEKQVKEISELVARLAGEIERLEKDYATKQALEKELEKVEKRVTNLGVLMNMFSGAGFVNYVSTIYLRNLCDMANHRFHRLTNNQLSLQLNDNNDFEIIDYLNNGKARSVKTLSGGQSFQVSLSLALALAESVQSLSKSNKNFFFIDEGFGTQDADAVNIVFETLSNLHKENRIVGIISHVDELQERIPMSLSIHKDEERGSLIEVNI